MIPQITFSLFLLMTIFFLAFHLNVGTIGLASNLNALMIVLGGTLSATLIAYPWRKLTWTAHLLRKAYSAWHEIDSTREALVTLARTYRKSGIRGLEQQVEEFPDGLMKSAVDLFACRYGKERIEEVLQKEAQVTYSQYETAYKIIYSMARLAPALGLTGTIINLIRVFGHIADAQSLIGYMAIALLSTFYGVVLANLLFVPLANKLREFMDHEAIRFELIQEGIMDIYDDVNPRAIEYKLEASSRPVLTQRSVSPRSRLLLMPSRKQPSSVIS